MPNENEMVIWYAVEFMGKTGKRGYGWIVESYARTEAIAQGFADDLPYTRTRVRKLELTREQASQMGLA